MDRRFYFIFLLALMVGACSSLPQAEEGDTTSPLVSSVVATSATSAKVIFNEEIQESSAESTGNYSIAGLAISVAALGSDSKTIALTTASQTPNQAYTITISNIPDLAGNVMTTQVSTFSGYNPSVRTVIAEVFTGTWCGWCPYADRAIERLATEEGSDKLVVLEYHYNDVYAISEVVDRMDYYDVEGFPTVIFDGIVTKTGVPLGEGDYEQLCYDAYKTVLTNRTTWEAPVSISGEVMVAGSVVSVSATISNASSALSNLVINGVVYEDLNESEFRFVVRDILDSQAVSSLAAGASQNYSASSTTLSGVGMSNVAAVIFVQDSDTKEILASKKVSP